MGKTLEYIGKRFKSKDGYWCEIIKRVTKDKLPCQCVYRVRFDDGFECEHTYPCLVRGDFNRYGKMTTVSFIGRVFVSKDDKEFKVLSLYSWGFSPLRRKPTGLPVGYYNSQNNRN